MPMRQKRNQKGFVGLIVLIVGVLALAGVAGYFAVDQQTGALPAPAIESISPSEAPIRTQISVAGSGFAPTGNSLQFGAGMAYINNLLSYDGKTIHFVLPESFDTCNPDGSVCAGLLSQPVVGQTDEVAVINTNGESNRVNFTVAYEEGAPIPTPAPSPKPIPQPTPSPSPRPDNEQTSLIMREGQREGPFLLEKIYADRVTGLNFLEYPVPREEGFPVTLRIGETASNGCTIQLTLLRIEGGTAIFRKNVDMNYPCPICLAEHTLIDTPTGAVPVEDLKKGMEIWTTNGSGERVSAIIEKTGKTSVPHTHRIVHLVLENGRELFVSPGHPTGDGRTIGNLVAGDSLNGGTVTSAKLVPYQNGYTYDILPSGDTGRYWANGILIGSTLW